MDTITLHQLEIFVPASKRLNLTEVARAFHVTPSTISHEIKKLEHALSVSLVKKSRTGIELTEAGKALSDGLETTPVSRLNELFKQVSSKASQARSETLTIGASHGPSRRVVPSLLARFRSEFPDIRIIHRTGTSADIEELLHKRAVDIAFISNPSRRQGLTIQPFAAERLMFVAARGYPMKKLTITTGALAKMPLLVGKGNDGESTTVNFLRQRLSERLDLKIAMEFDDPEALKSAVQRGLGVGVLYEDMVAKELRSGSLRELRLAGVNLDGHSSIVYLNDQLLSPVARQFVKFARLQWKADFRSEHQTRSPTLPRRMELRRVEL